MSSTAGFAQTSAVAPPGLPPATWGYIFVIVSTILYALYEVLYKRLLSPDKIAATLSKVCFNVVRVCV
jgi:drug/metabolite transporter (DMT)-like permease